MAITLYSGTPGSGKSYRIADQLSFASLIGKRTYICNFPVDLENYSIRDIFRPLLRSSDEQSFGRRLFAKLPYNVTHKTIKREPIYMDNSQITVPFLKQYALEHHSAGREGQTVVVIDEAGIKFNCRNFADRDRQEWLNFFATHRHYGFDFILIAQSDRQLDRQIRYCIEQEDKHYKLANFNWFGWILAKLSGGNLFVVHKSWYGFHGTRNGTDVIRYRRKVASIYDTHYKF